MLNLITVHVHKSSEDAITFTAFFTSSGLRLRPGSGKAVVNGRYQPGVARVCAPLFSHLSVRALLFAVLCH